MTLRLRLALVLLVGVAACGAPSEGTRTGSEGDDSSSVSSSLPWAVASSVADAALAGVGVAVSANSGSALTLKDSARPVCAADPSLFLITSGGTAALRVAACSQNDLRTNLRGTAVFQGFEAVLEEGILPMDGEVSFDLWLSLTSGCLFARTPEACEGLGVSLDLNLAEGGVLLAGPSGDVSRIERFHAHFEGTWSPGQDGRGRLEGRFTELDFGSSPGDSDGDGTPDPEDNCPVFYNPRQIDADGDGEGDLCEAPAPPAPREEPPPAVCDFPCTEDAGCEDHPKADAYRYVCLDGCCQPDLPIACAPDDPDCLGGGEGFCGDDDCSEKEGEDCSTCEADCGPCGGECELEMSCPDFAPSCQEADDFLTCTGEDPGEDACSTLAGGPFCFCDGDSACCVCAF